MLKERKMLKYLLPFYDFYYYWKITVLLFSRSGNVISFLSKLAWSAHANASKVNTANLS